MVEAIVQKKLIQLFPTAFHLSVIFSYCTANDRLDVLRSRVPSRSQSRLCLGVRRALSASHPPESSLVNNDINSKACNGVFIISICLAMPPLGNSWRITAFDPQPAREELKNQCQRRLQPRLHPKSHCLLSMPRQKTLPVPGLCGRTGVPREEKRIQIEHGECLQTTRGQLVQSEDDPGFYIILPLFCLHIWSQSPHDKGKRPFTWISPRLLTCAVAGLGESYKALHLAQGLSCSC